MKTDLEMFLSARVEALELEVKRLKIKLAQSKNADLKQKVISMVHDRVFDEPIKVTKYN